LTSRGFLSIMFSTLAYCSIQDLCFFSYVNKKWSIPVDNSEQLPFLQTRQYANAESLRSAGPWRFLKRHGNLFLIHCSNLGCSTRFGISYRWFQRCLTTLSCRIPFVHIGHFIIVLLSSGPVTIFCLSPKAGALNNSWGWGKPLAPSSVPKSVGQFWTPGVWPPLGNSLILYHFWLFYYMIIIIVIYLYYVYGINVKKEDYVHCWKRRLP
jgi:hypothetical protein